jgi:hypothetical protein
MKPLVFYTVDFYTAGYPVSYIDTDTFKVKVWSGPFEDRGFVDPVEAMGEFEACIGEPTCWLDLLAFQARVKQIAREKALLASWNTRRQEDDGL